MSTDPHLAFEVLRYKAIREALLADNADDIDEQTLADTTEGLTDLHELLAAIVRATIEDEVMVSLLKARISEMSHRTARFEARAERRRAIVRNAMLKADINKLTMPDFTASVRKNPPRVVIFDEALIPADYVELRRHVLKRELGEALKNGTQIEGAVLSNSEMTLSVRTK